MTEENNKLLDDYFEQEMSTSELENFSEELETNEVLKKEFELRHLTAAAFQREELVEFKKEMQERYALKKPIEPTRKTIRLRPILLTIAASILALIGFFTWQLWDSYNSSSQAFAKYDLEEVFPQTQYALVNEGLFHKGIVDSEDFHELKKAGLKAYDAREWDVAIALFNEYLSKATITEENTPDEINLINLYLGRAFLENRETDKAIETLQKAVNGVVDSINYGILKEIMQWQLALAHIKNEDNRAARQLIESLQNARHTAINKEVPNLLNDLK